MICSSKRIFNQSKDQGPGAGVTPFREDQSCQKKKNNGKDCAVSLRIRKSGYPSVKNCNDREWVCGGGGTYLKLLASTVEKRRKNQQQNGEGHRRVSRPFYGSFKRIRHPGRVEGFHRGKTFRFPRLGRVMLHLSVSLRQGKGEVPRVAGKSAPEQDGHI